MRADDDPRLSGKRHPHAGQREDTIFGAHPAAALLSTRSRRVVRATVALGDSDGQRRLLPWLAGVPAVVRVERDELDRLSRNGVHQGVVLECAPLRALRELPYGLAPDAVEPVGGRGPPPLLVALDGVVDPHNVGAILRSALLLGADGVLFAASGGPPLGGTMSKTSAGALEVWLASERLHEVRNLATFLAAAAAAGWRVLGAAAAAARGDGVAPLPLARLSRNEPTVLVLGNEGAGLGASVRAACTAFVCVPMSLSLQKAACAAAAPAATAAARSAGHADLPALPLVDSLNVSVAAALILHQLRPPDSETSG